MPRARRAPEDSRRNQALRGRLDLETEFILRMETVLDNCPYFSYETASRSRQGRQPATPADGASAVPAGGGSSPPLPGGSGIMPAGTMTGVRGASL